MKRIARFVIGGFLLFLLTGCFNTKDLEEIAFISALGIDYQDGHYILYTQSINFGNIAKQASSVKEQPPVIGVVKGETIPLAFSYLLQNSPQPPGLGSIQTIILSKNIVKNKLRDTIQAISQFPLFRYNSLLFGTEENLQELLNCDDLYSDSPLSTILYSAENTTSNDYWIPVIKFNQFVSRYYRPVGTAMIPTLKINKKTFIAKKNKNIATLNGAYFLSNQHLKGWLSKKDLEGIKWFYHNPSGENIFVHLKNETINVKKHKVKIKVLKGKKPTYTILLNGKSIIFTNIKNKNLKTSQKDFNAKMQKDILNTIKNGDKIHADVLNISEQAYNYHPEWDDNTIRSFQADSIKQVKVDMMIEESANIKQWKNR